MAGSHRAGDGAAAAGHEGSPCRSVAASACQARTQTALSPLLWRRQGGCQGGRGEIYIYIYIAVPSA